MLRKGLILYLSLLLFIGSSLSAENQPFIEKIKPLSGKELDTLKIPKSTPRDYMLMTDYAIDLYQDSANRENSVKGEILLSIIADHLTKEINSGVLSVNDSQVSTLCEKYKKYNYYICQVKISDFIKLAHYACEGDYQYIYSRFKVKWYFIPAIVIIVVFLVFSISNVAGVVKWKYKKRYNITFLIFIGLILVISIIFTKTCDKYVTEHSFYGIPF